MRKHITAAIIAATIGLCGYMSQFHLVTMEVRCNYQGTVFLDDYSGNIASAYGDYVEEGTRLDYWKEGEK